MSSRADERWRCGAGTMDIAGRGQGRPGGAVPIAIAGGTSQILLSVVAERVLGLPRDGAR
jgi:hypothetical protein